LDHPKRQRPSKAKRAQCKKALELLDQEADPTAYQQAVTKLAAHSEYMSYIVDARLKQRYQEDPDDLHPEASGSDIQSLNEANIAFGQSGDVNEADEYGTSGRLSL